MVMVNMVCGPEEAKKLSNFSLRNNTIEHRIGDMSKDIVALVTQELPESRCRFSLQLDKSTDLRVVVSCGFSTLLDGFTVKEVFLFYSLKATTKSGTL